VISVAAGSAILRLWGRSGSSVGVCGILGSVWITFNAVTEYANCVKLRWHIGGESERLWRWFCGDGSRA
jgi:hypothetical protein